MSGGIVQLVATGAQDTWLSGRPEISFFRSNYKRYTHYAAAVERQIIQGNPTAGSISTIRLEKKGDLLSYMYFTARDQNGSQVNNLDWSKVIDRVELLIGGQVIDLQDYNYSTDIEPCTGAQTYNQRYLNNDATPTSTTNLTGPTNKIASFYPLKFFFCKDWSVSLPLVALQYHDVEIRITWSVNLNSVVGNLVTSSPQPATAVSLTGLGNAYASANLFQSASASQNFVSSTANLILLSNTFVGPLSSGLVAGNPASLFTNVQSTVGLSTVQFLSNVNSSFTVSANTTANAIISFSNTANLGITGDYTAGTNLSFWLPQSSGLVIGPSSISSTSTSAVLTLTAPLRSTGFLVGQIVVGLPIPGIVYITAVTTPTSPSTTTTINVAFTALTSTITIPGGTLISTVPSNYLANAPSTLTYAQLSYQCWTNFVYLDQAEREYFAQSSHDLLVTQVQRIPISSNPVQELALAHPVKFLAFQSQAYGTIYNQGGNSVSASNYQLKVQINGVDVGESRPLPAWTDANQYYHTSYGYLANNLETSILVIPYCLDTSKLQPTGTLNFSRLDTYRLVVPNVLANGLSALVNTSVNSPYLYAVNYNVLRIQKGMGSLLYAN